MLGPAANVFILVGRAARKAGKHGAIEERQIEIAQVEQADVQPFALFQMVFDPVGRCAGEAAVTSAANDDGNGGHDESPEEEGEALVHHGVHFRKTRIIQKDGLVGCTRS